MVNTCGFIAEAKQESIDTILEMAQYKEKGRCRRLVVTGCLAQRYAQDHTDFVNASAKINSFSIKGIKGSTDRFFMDSNLSASLFGKISLLNGDFDTGNTGIFAYETEGVNVIQSVKYKDTVTNESWSWPLKPNVLPSVQDDIIHIL